MQSFIESLEARRLMSAGLVPVSVDGAEVGAALHKTAAPRSIVGEYKGNVKLHAAGQTITATVTLDINTYNSRTGGVTGQVSTSLSGNVVSFNKKKSKLKSDNTFVFTYDDKHGTSGTLSGNYLKGKQLKGDFSGEIAGYPATASFTLNRVA
jgi:hypothetical protein